MSAVHGGMYMLGHRVQSVGKKSDETLLVNVQPTDDADGGLEYETKVIVRPCTTSDLVVYRACVLCSSALPAVNELALEHESINTLESRLLIFPPSESRQHKGTVFWLQLSSASNNAPRDMCKCLTDFIVLNT